MSEEWKFPKIGLDSQMLTAPTPQLDIDELAQTAKRLGLLPRSYSTSRVRPDTNLRLCPMSSTP